MIDKPLDCVGVDPTKKAIGKHDFQPINSEAYGRFITSMNIKLAQWAEQHPEAVAAIIAGEAVVMPATIGRDRLVEAAYHKTQGGGFFVEVEKVRLDKARDVCK